MRILQLVGNQFESNATTVSHRSGNGDLLVEKTEELERRKKRSQRNSAKVLQKTKKSGSNYDDPSEIWNTFQ